MQVEGFSEWLGQVLGSIIRFIVDALSGLFNLLSNASSNFVEGLSQALGMETSVVSIVTLILGLILLRRRSFWDIPHRVFAAAAALVAWLLLFSPIFWEHYHAYLVPFWGWLAYEATRSRVRAGLAILVVVMAYLPSSILVSQLHLPRLPEPLFSHLMWSTVLMFGMAVERLARDARIPSKTMEDRHG